MEQKFGINSLDLQMLREFCEHEGKVVSYQKGERMECEGESANWFGFVTEGCFKYTTNGINDGKKQLPGVMFFSATYHDAETAKRITDKHHFTWTHLVEAKDMMAWIGYEGFPLTIVVDKKGIVRHAVHGTNETKREELLAKIKEAEAK